MWLRKIGKCILILLLIWLFVYLTLVFFFRASHDREWELGHEALPRIVYSATSSVVTIENFRDFIWTSATQAEVQYVTKSFDLEQIERVDVFISHFDEFEGLAHIFLSFGFSDGEHIAVSLETRRETHETFSPVRGLFRQYEIIYVVGSEADIAGVRTGHRDERVYLYPTIATPEQARGLFNALAIDINSVYGRPQMYNTLTNNCTNRLTRPIERISDIDFPLTWKSVLPGYFDEVLYSLELIDTSAPFAEIKQQHLVDNALLDAKSHMYSVEMREQVEGEILEHR